MTLLLMKKKSGIHLIRETDENKQFKVTLSMKQMKINSLKVTLSEKQMKINS